MVTPELTYSMSSMFTMGLSSSQSYSTLLPTTKPATALHVSSAHACRHPPARTAHDLALVCVLEGIVHGAVLHQRDDTIAEHLRMDAQVAMRAQGRQDLVVAAAVAAAALSAHGVAWVGGGLPRQGWRQCPSVAWRHRPPSCPQSSVQSLPQPRPGARRSAAAEAHPLQRHYREGRTGPRHSNRQAFAGTHARRPNKHARRAQGTRTLNQAIKVGHMNNAIAMGARHVLVDLPDHNVGRLQRCSCAVHRHTQAAKAMPIRGTDLPVHQRASPER